MAGMRWALGLDLLVIWFPGIDDELEQQGAVWIDGSRAWVNQAGGNRAEGDWVDPRAPSAGSAGGRNKRLWHRPPRPVTSRQ